MPLWSMLSDPSGLRVVKRVRTLFCCSRRSCVQKAPINARRHEARSDFDFWLSQTSTSGPFPASQCQLRLHLVSLHSTLFTIEGLESSCSSGFDRKGFLTAQHGCLCFLHTRVNQPNAPSWSSARISLCREWSSLAERVRTVMLSEI